MRNIISKNKMSKKARKELAKKDRKVWQISPVTRIVPNKKKNLQKSRTAWKRQIAY